MLGDLLQIKRLEARDVKLGHGDLFDGHILDKFPNLFNFSEMEGMARKNDEAGP